MDEKTAKICPTCREKPEMTSKPDRLDQCAYTYLPAERWSCRSCDTSIVVRTGEAWRSK